MFEMKARESDSATWQDEVYDLLRQHNITQFAYVPDGGHKRMIARALSDNEAEAISLTNESEGPGIMIGADLGGSRGVVLVQSSGVGNLINNLSIITLGRFPFLMLVSMRGDFGEGNPWQFPMGQAVEPVLQAMGISTVRIDHPQDAVRIVDFAISQAFRGRKPTAVLLSQMLIGRKLA